MGASWLVVVGGTLSMPAEQKPSLFSLLQTYVGSHTSSHVTNPPDSARELPATWQYLCRGADCADFSKPRSCYICGSSDRVLVWDVHVGIRIAGVLEVQAAYVMFSYTSGFSPEIQKLEGVGCSFGYASQEIRKSRLNYKVSICLTLGSSPVTHSIGLGACVEIPLGIHSPSLP